MFKHEFPIVAGFDYAGTVQAVGNGVRGFSVGDRAHGMNGLDLVRHGTYAEITITPAGAVSHIPQGMTYEVAAAIPTVALTASQSLIDFGSITPGQTVLIQAGAGGVGGMAIQIAKNRGATVLTTARSCDSEYVTDLGADHVIDFETLDFVEIARDYFPHGLDMVVDMIGGETLARGYQTLAKGGRMALLVGQPDKSHDEEFEVVSEFVFTLPNAKRLGELADMMINGSIKLPKIKTVNLEDARSAQIESESGYISGKLILKVQ